MREVFYVEEGCRESDHNFLFSMYSEQIGRAKVAIFIPKFIEQRSDILSFFYQDFWYKSEAKLDEKCILKLILCQR